MRYAMVTVHYLDDGEAVHTFNDVGEAMKFVEYVDESFFLFCQRLFHSLYLSIVR